MLIPITTVCVELLDFRRIEGRLAARVRFEDGEKADIAIEASDDPFGPPTDQSFLVRDWGQTAFFVEHLIDTKLIEITGIGDPGLPVRFRWAAFTAEGKRLLREHGTCINAN